jgi:hypothetical protein
MREEAWPDSSLQAPLYIYRIKAVTSVEAENTLVSQTIGNGGGAWTSTPLGACSGDIASRFDSSLVILDGTHAKPTWTLLLTERHVDLSGTGPSLCSPRVLWQQTDGDEMRTDNDARRALCLEGREHWKHRYLSLPSPRQLTRLLRGSNSILGCAFAKKPSRLYHRLKRPRPIENRNSAQCHWHP